MNYELWLKKITDFLVNAGVPAEHGPMAALGLVYLCLTLLFLVYGLAYLLEYALAFLKPMQSPPSASGLQQVHQDSLYNHHPEEPKTKQEDTIPM